MSSLMCERPFRSRSRGMQQWPQLAPPPQAKRAWPRCNASPIRFPLLATHRHPPWRLPGGRRFTAGSTGEGGFGRPASSVTLAGRGGRVILSQSDELAAPVPSSHSARSTLSFQAQHRHAEHTPLIPKRSPLSFRGEAEESLPKSLQPSAVRQLHAAVS